MMSWLDTFEDIRNKNFSEQLAVMFGSLSVEPPDLELAGAIGELFS